MSESGFLPGPLTAFLQVEFPLHLPICCFPAFSLYTASCQLDCSTHRLTFPSSQPCVPGEQASVSSVLPLSSLCCCSQHRCSHCILWGKTILLLGLPDDLHWGLHPLITESPLRTGNNSLGDVCWNLIRRQNLCVGWGGRERRERERWSQSRARLEGEGREIAGRSQGGDGMGWMGEEVSVLPASSCHPSSLPGGEISIPPSSLPKCSEFRKERAKP